MDNAVKYNSLYKAVCKAKSQASKQEQQNETNRIWKKIKRGETTYEYVTVDLASKALASRTILLSFKSRAQAPAATVSKPEMHEISAHADVDALAPAMMISGASDVLPLISAVDAASIPSTSAMPDPTTKTTKTAVTPQQISVQRDISDAQEQLLALVHLRDAGLITKELEKKMKSVELNLKHTKKK
ncbi:hypothetical protein ACJMK2_001975 [Sinanodonta woodiana]|uniref:Uncharacterized protein n=1 Tax=Sinanodonta woodiana TaxID=1069815 RepID=A0ABD3XTV2_SINWO